MGLPEFDEAGAFGIARDIAFERNWPQLAGGALRRAHDSPRLF
jgi:hypothetical protein